MKKYALVIGVSRYEDPDITDLNFAAYDAEELGSALREICGFHDVRVLASGEREPEHVNIVDALCGLAPLLTAEDMFLFYFAGHGIVTNTGAHLLASNSRIRMPELASVSWETLGDCLSRIECVDRVLILDACRNDPNKGMGEQDNLLTSRFSRDILAVADTVVEGKTPATCVLFSCKLGERAYEWPDKRHGAFTHYLLEGLRGAAADERGRITVDGLGRYVEEQVPRWAMKVRTPRPQTPWAEREGSLREIVLVAGATAARRAHMIDEPSKGGPRPELKNSSQITWYYIHPEVEKEWLGRNGGTVTIAIENSLKISDISPEKIECQGLIYQATYANGKPILWTSYGALFATEEMDLLKKLLEKEKDPKSDARVLGLLIGGEREKARYELKKVMVREGSSITRLLVLYKGFGDQTEAEQCLRKMEDKADGSWCLRDCAKAWKKIFDNNSEALRCLKRAESKADGGLDWASIAEAWKELSDNNSEAMRCLGEAESKADGITDWRYCAGIWKKVFDDDSAVMRCLKRAESKVHGGELGLCAEAWKELLGDDGEAMRCLKGAEREAESSYDWGLCGKAWKDLFDDDNAARRCLKRAASEAGDSTSWRSCAYIWKRVLDDDGAATRCLKRAESKADDSLDWRFCARAYKELFDDDGAATRCLKRAESKADGGLDWADCAEKWKELINDDREAMRCLREAESEAETHADWWSCLHCWSRVLDNDSEAMCCLKRSESKATSSGDWKFCAEAWMKFFDNNSEAMRALRVAESTAHGSNDWKVCAEGWKELFDDEGEAARCERRATGNKRSG